MTHLAFMGFSFPIVEMEMLENSLVVQWLRLHAPSVRGLGSILGQGAHLCFNYHSSEKLIVIINNV